jgi:hypothetical protein
MSKKSLSFTLATSLILSLSTSVFAALDLTAIPLGDGKVSSSPKVGYIYSCQQTFPANAPGASTNGSWIHGNTWSLPEKLSVLGNVTWPNAAYTSSVSGDTRSVTSNSLPVDSHTGTFPVSSSDPAYTVDKNPNTITAQNITLSLPANPSISSTPSCVGMGMIGVAVNGVAIFNALDAGGKDAVAHEVQDTCGGHPEKQGEYHYHGPSGCVPHQNEKNALVGYALDGFGIYSNIDAQGKSLTNADLDECHGTTSIVKWNGKDVSMYHYVLTNEYPYTIGCYRGTPISTQGAHPQTEGASSGMSQRIAPTVPSVTEEITTTLTTGSKGSDVEKLQTFLESKGYLSLPKEQAKGYFGAMTRKAVMMFQKENKISTTGTFGPKTKASVNESIKKTNNSRIKSATGSPLSSRTNGMMMTRKAPQVAIDACTSKEDGAACSFVGMEGETVTGTCFVPPAQESAVRVCGPKNMGAR